MKLKKAKTCDRCAAYRGFQCELNYGDDRPGIWGIICTFPPQTGCPKPLTTAEFIEAKNELFRTK